MPFLSVDVVCRFWEAGFTLATSDQVWLLESLKPLPKELRVMILEKYLMNQVLVE